MPADEIGYYFSGDEKNTFELVRQGRVAGGGVSNQDYDELPEDQAAEINAFDRTISLPRQLVSVRTDVEPGMVARVTELLIGLDQIEEGRQLLKSIRDSKFDPLTSEIEKELNDFRELMNLLEES